jgi:2-oxoisovalerate dehydrogenase E1 component alpha subunit
VCYLIHGTSVLNSDGKVRKGAEDPDLPEDLVKRMYNTMVTIANMDNIFYEAQRQGRISFYM